MSRTTHKLAREDVQSARLQQLATLGSLAASSASEIGHLVGELLVNLQAATAAADALDGADDDVRADLDTALDASRTCGEQLRDTARRMMSCAHSAPDEPELLDVTGVVDDAIETVLPALRHHAVLHREYESVLPRVRANRGQLRQLMLNLMVNAIQACTHSSDGTNHCITVEVRLSDQWVCIDVRDTGPGVDPEIADRLFDPFFTTRHAAGAAGLGLTISRAIASDHGGQIVVGAPGKGATFTVVLPAA